MQTKFHFSRQQGWVGGWGQKVGWQAGGLEASQGLRVAPPPPGPLDGLLTLRVTFDTQPI